MSERRYTKILVAQHSPENGCLAENGAVLYFMPRRNQAKAHARPAGFLSARDHRTRSRFGWVTVVSEEFSVDEFVEQFLNRPRVKLDENDRAVVRQLLDVIAALPEGTPVGATYVERGVEQRTIQILFHKVFFARRKEAS